VVCVAIVWVRERRRCSHSVGERESIVCAAIVWVRERRRDCSVCSHSVGEREGERRGMCSHSVGEREERVWCMQP
jgi:hypothetical protein